MTAQELRSFFNERFGIEEEWPKKFEVDAETYGYCCQAVFSNPSTSTYVAGDTNLYFADIWLGPHKGLMFKSVELILKNAN